MTIQPSVVVWTIICFAALYLILKYLLFDPLLSVMDARETKILNAENEKEIARRRSEENLQRISLEREKAEREYRESLEKKSEKLRLEGREKLKDAKAERNAYVEEYRRKTGEEYTDDMEKAASMTNDAANLFISRLFNS